MQQTTTPRTVSPNAQPSIEVRELKIYATGTRKTATGLHFHTVDDANIALHAIADAQEAFQWTFGPDLASSLPGAHIVAVYWAMHTALYRLDCSTPATRQVPRPIAVLR